MGAVDENGEVIEAVDGPDERLIVVGGDDGDAEVDVGH